MENMGLGKSSVEESGVHSWAEGDPTSLTTMRIEAPGIVYHSKPGLKG